LTLSGSRAARFGRSEQLYTDGATGTALGVFGATVGCAMKRNLLDLETKRDLLDLKNIALYQQLIMSGNLEEPRRMALLSRLREELEKFKNN
jgi:hypothetical protein